MSTVSRRQIGSLGGEVAGGEDDGDAESSAASVVVVAVEAEEVAGCDCDCRPERRQEMGVSREVRWEREGGAWDGSRVVVGGWPEPWPGI